MHLTRFLAGEAFVSRHLVQLERSAQRLLHELYNELLAPILNWLDQLAPLGAEELRQLLIVPYGILHQVPFHALHDGNCYLVERCVISYAPSTTVFAHCQQRQRRGEQALTIATADAQIPAAMGEAREVAHFLQQQYGAVHLLLGEQATLSAMTHLAHHAGTIHLACHGLFRRDNPMFSALKLHDGWLTALEITQLHLPGALVTLSACESGRSQLLGGEEMLGLTYAFLSAGAASLVVSQWLVQDEATALLMARWYRHLASQLDHAAALRLAQLDVMASYNHPYYWAPFVLIGQR